MDTSKKIEHLIAQKYDRHITTKKAIGDFMLSSYHAVNVKSNNIAKQNYSPNMISIKKLHNWIFEERKNLSFIFVDYIERNGMLEILNITPPIPIEHISWKCLSIEAQGYGVIQKIKKLKIIETQTKKDFYKGFLIAYEKFRKKELKKHENFSKKFIKNIDNINW